MSSPNSGGSLEYNPIGPGAIVEVVEGDNATLECRAEGIPRPSLEWVSRFHKVDRSMRVDFGYEFGLYSWWGMVFETQESHLVHPWTLQGSFGVISILQAH